MELLLHHFAGTRTGKGPTITNPGEACFRKRVRDDSKIGDWFASGPPFPITVLLAARLRYRAHPVKQLPWCSHAPEPLVSFVVSAQFVGEAARLVAADECNLYLDQDQRWRSLEKAARFATWKDAEMAMQEKWHRLRATGNRSIILSILELQE